MTTDREHPLARVSLFAAVAMLGYALQIHDGFYDEAALVWLTAALVLCAAAVFTLRWPLLATGSDRLPRVVAVLAIAWHATLLLTSRPAMYLQPNADLQLFQAGIAAQVLLVSVGFAGGTRVARIWFPLLLAVHVALGIWLIHASPTPAIDVVVVHRDAIDAMTAGKSPYAISFQNIYSPDQGFYNPDAVADNRVMFGYPYPPLNLLAAAPAHWLTGDYRYAQLAAWVGAAALVGFMRQGLVAKLAAVLLLMQPRGFFVLEQGWTEPLALFMFALTLFAMTRVPALAAWAAGLLVETKQYLVLAIPLLWRFAASRPGTRRFILTAALVATAVTLPFLLWSPRPFIESVVLLQLREPMRFDSLSLMSWGAQHGLLAPSFVWALAAAAVTVAITMLATPNTPAGFAASLAFSSFVTFAFGSKAFCNYYFFVAGAMCCAAAARQRF